MARIFITGSSDGLGQMAAQLLVEQEHSVVLHARNAQRGEVARAAVPEAAALVIGDFSSLAQIGKVSEEVNRLGAFNAVIHNAAVGYKEKQRVLTEDGLPLVFQVNTLAPYMLTALIGVQDADKTAVSRPKRLIYISSELHRKADASLDDLLWESRAWNGTRAYSETKLHDTLLAFAIARRWPGVLSNSVEPGWVATKMGGPRASGDLDAGPRTQAWLAVSDEPAAKVSGQHWYHKEPRAPKPVTRDVDVQEKLLEACERLSGVKLPS